MTVLTALKGIVSHRSGMVAQADAAQRHRLDHADVAAEVDHVADGHRVLGQDEDAGDDVLHQCLRAEADGEA